MHDLFIQEALAALLQVIMIDLTLAGDNAIVIGLAAAGLPREQRNKAILVGIVAATVLRIIFAGLTIQLLQIVGLLFAGGILLIWVCWKMWRELRLSHRDEENAANALTDQSPHADGTVAASAPHKSFAQAAWQIVIADVSMSLDNVLAVAGAAREHPVVLIFGLTLSIALMGLAASLIARVLQRRRWIAYVGLAVILYVACEMIYRGALEMWPMLSWTQVIIAGVALFVVVEIVKAVFQGDEAGRGHPVSEAARKGGWGRQAAAAGALAVLAFGGGWLYWSLYGGVRYLTQKVERGSVVRIVTASGVVNPTAAAPLGARVWGMIQALYCDRDMKVAKGQLCAKIDPLPYQIAADQAKADLAVAEARFYNDKADLARAKAAFEHKKTLVKRRAISRKALDAPRKAHAQALARMRSREAAIVGRRAALTAVEVALDHNDIVAPVEGMVISRNVEMGQTVAAGMEAPLFVFATDLVVMRVDARVGEKDIDAVKRGDKATFTVGTLPDHSFAGTVSRIEQTPQTTPDVATYNVAINAPNPDLLLKPGMTTTTSIVVGRRDDVLRAPSQALRYSPGGRVDPTDAAGPGALPGGASRLWVLRDGKPIAILVDLGLDDGVYTEVVKGDLHAGDDLIIGESHDT
jgi:HlyD family secretion protein